MVYDRPPPREITQIIQFPSEETGLDITKIYNQVLHKPELCMKRDTKNKAQIIKYNLGDKVLIKKRQLQSSIEGIARKLLLLYSGPYVVTKDKSNNTYKLTVPNTNQPTERYI